MGRKQNKSTILVAENVYLKKSGDSEVFHYYFKVGGFQFRKSTKTSDLTKAKQIALNAYHDAVDKKRSGKTAEKVSFKKLSTKYLDQIKGQTKYKYHSEQIERCLKPFFVEFDDISKINKGVLNDYLTYRQKKSNYNITNQTLNRENTVLRQLLKFGADHEWCAKDLKIEHLSEKNSARRRPHFTLKEYTALLKASKQRVAEFKNPKIKGKKRTLFVNKYWQRALLHDVILLISNTGSR